MRELVKANIVVFTTLTSYAANADIGRVYHPYVEMREREIEYGLTLRDTSGESVWLHRFGVGYAWSENVFTEVYVLSDAIAHGGEKIDSYEVEVKWQLTEQGEYWADWGLLLEMGTAKDIRRHELAVGVIWEKELSNRWVATANVIAEYEFGSDIVREFESALRGQFRYRYSQAIEPAFEFYLDDQDWAAGPALIGAQKLGSGKQLKWELGVLFGLDSETPANNLRLSIELEF